ncbi:MAG: right-handed parallel beta-helix repeat-containing protein, partial [Planctomycetota bacterium]
MSAKAFWHVSFVLLVLALVATPAIAMDDFFVDAINGDDINGDGSAGNPWRTITHSVQLLPAGTHRILIAPGVYDLGHGETFPIEPPLGTTLESTDGREVTRIVGPLDRPVIRQIGGNNPRTVLSGLTIEGGSDGVWAEGPGSSLGMTIANTTISGSARACVYSKQQVGIGATDTILRGATYGWLHDSSTIGGVGLYDSVISDCLADGIRVDHRGTTFRFNIVRSVVTNNGGFGLWQRGHNQAITSATIDNSIVSFNAAGGVRSVSYLGCGGTCAPWTSVGLAESTVYGNGASTGFGGLERVGDSPFHFCVISTSISWGNLGLDNTNFDPSFSNIGTGHKTGGGMISGDPRFVDGPGGDFRLLPTSPCIDRLAPTATSNYDHENEPRPTDGNGDGDFKSDMGADELHTFVAPGVPPVTGSPFYFIAGGPVTERGQLLTVLLSHDDGAKTGGIRLPGSGGLTVNLAPGLLFQTGLMLLPALQTTLRAGRTTETPTVTLPPNPFDPKIYFAGVAFDI